MSLSQFGSDLGRFPDIEYGVTRLTLGGDDGYAYRNYYMVDIADQARGSSVTVRHSKVMNKKFSLDAFNQLIARCAP